MTAADARFVAAYERHYRRVYAYCRRRVDADHVDDVVADTFLTAWRKVEELPVEDEVLAWLYSIAYRHIGHQWRGSSRRRRLSEKLRNIGVEPVERPDEVVVVGYESSLAIEAMARLKKSDRELLRLSIWEQLSQQEMATVLGIKPGAVKQRLFEARKRVTKEFNRLENKPSTSSLQERTS